MVSILSASCGASKDTANCGPQQPATEYRRIPSAPLSLKIFSNSCLAPSVIFIIYSSKFQYFYYNYNIFYPDTLDCQPINFLNCSYPLVPSLINGTIAHFGANSV